MNAKRILAVLLALALVLSMAACTSNQPEQPAEPTEPTEPAQPAEPEEPAVELGTGPDGRTYAAEQVYRTLYSSEMTTMNYLVSGTTYELEVGANTIDSLVENDTYGNIVPCAAESWEESDDGLVWTFHLRPNQFWYDKDGNQMAPVTANDYVAAARYVCDSANDCGNSYLMEGWLVNAEELLEYTAAKMVAVEQGTEGDDDDYVYDADGKIYEITDDGYAEMEEIKPEDLGVVATDDLTLEYHLCFPRPYFPTVLQFGTYWPAPASLLEELGTEYGLDNESMWFNGAYILQTAQPQQKRVYVKNENNWDAEHIYIERIEETYNQEAATLAPEMFLRGEIDSASIGSDIVADWLADPEKSNMICTSRIVGDYSYFFGFCFEPKFDAQYEPENWIKAVNCEDFRQCIFHAIDREAYLTAKYPGDDPHMHMINTVTPLGFSTYDGKDYVNYGGLAKYTAGDSFDEKLALEYKEKAKAELEAAGATFPIKMPINYNPSSTTWGNATVVLEQQLEGLLGSDFIDIIVVEYAGNSFLTDTRRSGNYAIQELNWGADFMDPETWADPFDRENTYNFFCYDTDTYRVFQDTKSEETYALIDEYFALCDHARTCVTDFNERYEAFAAAESFYLDHAIVVPGFISGGSYQATKLNGFEGQYAMMGQSSSRYKGQHVYAEAMSQEMYEEQYEAWLEALGQ
ncbi:MAG: peptide ABC transporter substrate-binding protein [Clostridia bacterium]|nr:peptide ABC transporter substrate-binding protein [Clostridia bacterium]